MSYKPDESTLIAYLFGELDEKELEKVNRYLEANPDEKKRLQEMVDARAVLSIVEDKEVIAPPVFLDDNHRTQPLWQSTPFRWISGIAASVLFLLITAQLLGLEVSYSQGETRISIGKRQQLPTAPQQESLTPNDVQSMINASVVKNNEFIAANWAYNQRKMDQTIRGQLEINSKKMETLVANASLSSQEQVRSFVNGLQKENLRSMKDYLQLSSLEQKKYVENLLVDFSKYLQEQRNQDLNAFQTRMSSMEKNTNQFKQETEEILSSIISNSGKRQNNY